MRIDCDNTLIIITSVVTCENFFTRIVTRANFFKFFQKKCTRPIINRLRTRRVWRSSQDGMEDSVSRGFLHSHRPYSLTLIRPIRAAMTNLPIEFRDALCTQYASEGPLHFCKTEFWFSKWPPGGAPRYGKGHPPIISRTVKDKKLKFFG